MRHDDTDLRLGSRETRRVLRHAAEMELADEAGGSRREEGLTLAELKEVASEAGIPSHYVEQAAARIGRPSRGRVFSPPPDPSAACVVRRVPGTLGARHWDNVVADIEAALGPGSAAMVGGDRNGRSDGEQSMIWSSTECTNCRTLVGVHCDGADTSFFLTNLQLASGVNRVTPAVTIAAFAVGAVWTSSTFDLHVLVALLCGLAFALVSGKTFETVAAWLSRRARGASNPPHLEPLADRLVRYPTLSTAPPPPGAPGHAVR